jgi:transcription-repair coupling factor (superfamily II helicase)
MHRPRVPATALNRWLSRASEQPAFRDRLARAASGEGCVVFDHIDLPATAWLLAVILDAVPRGKRCWILVDSPKHRERLALELELWKIRSETLNDPPIVVQEGEVSDPEGAAARLETLAYAGRANSCRIFASADVFGQEAPSPRQLESQALSLRVGDESDPQELAARLTAQGFERGPIVQSRGQFAIRGGILDVFPWQAGQPLRLEFFDTEIESIREFDIDSQASQRKLSRADLLLGDPELDATVADYRRDGDLVIRVGEPGESAIHHDILILEGANETGGEEDFSTACFGQPLGHFEAGDFILQDALRERFFNQLDEWSRDDWQVGIVFANRGEQERFQELLPVDQRKAPPEFITGELMESFTVPSAKLALLSSSEIFGRYQNPIATRRSRTDKQRISIARASLDEINEADLVVHSEYGIGRFRGIETGDKGEEQIIIEFRDGAQLRPTSSANTWVSAAALPSSRSSAETPGETPAAMPSKPSSTTRPGC